MGIRMYLIRTGVRESCFQRRLGGHDRDEVFGSSDARAAKSLARSSITQNINELQYAPNYSQYKRGYLACSTRREFVQRLAEHYPLMQAMLPFVHNRHGETPLHWAAGTRPRQPDKYHGQRDFLLLGNWIFSVDQYFILTDMPISKQGPFVSTLLRDEALLWYRSSYENWD